MKTFKLSFFLVFVFSTIMEPNEISSVSAIKLYPPYRQKGKHPPQLRKMHRKNHNRNPFAHRHRASSKDHAVINGEYREINRILIQKEVPGGLGYYPYGIRKQPIFIRRQREHNKKYIVFQDPYLPPGEGYLVVLKRIPPKMSDLPRGMSLDLGVAHGMTSRTSTVLYDAFHILLSNNVHGSVDRLNVRKLAYRIRTSFYGRKNARHQFKQRRQQLAHSRRRFALSRWRGKRSIASLNQEHFNSSLSLEHVQLPNPRLEIKFDGIGNSQLGPCKMTPLNMKKVLLHVKQLRSLDFKNNGTVTEAIEETEILDFDG